MAAGAGAWEATPPALTLSRAGHTATSLPNGKILVAGGQGDSYKALASAEVYDPKTRTWAPTANKLSEGRYDHTATLIPSTGQVVVAGGVVGPAGERVFTRTVEVYDYRTNAWSSGGELTVARANHTATALPNGQVLVVGGKPDPNYLESLPTTELYDPPSHTSTATASLSEGRWGHTATLLANGSVVVVGGHRGRNHDTEPDGPLALPELFSGGSWTQVAGGVPTPALRRLFHSATGLRDGRVLVAGGQHGNALASVNSVLVFDGGGWAGARPLQSPRELHTATLLTDGRLLLTGGLMPGAEASSPPLAQRTAEVFDPATGDWSSAGSLAKPPRAGAQAALVEGTACAAACGRVVVVGGATGDPVISPPLATTDVYIPPPVLGDIGPAQGKAGTTVTIAGFGLASVMEVRFEEPGRAVPIQCGGGAATGCGFDATSPDTRAQTSVPSHDPGPVNWTVTVVTAGGTATRPFLFTYDAVPVSTTVAGSPTQPGSSPGASRPAAEHTPPAPPGGSPSGAPTPANVSAGAHPAANVPGGGAQVPGNVPAGAPAPANATPAQVPGSAGGAPAPASIPGGAQIAANGAGASSAGASALAPGAAAGVPAGGVAARAGQASHQGPGSSVLSEESDDPATEPAARYGMDRAREEGVPAVVFAGAAMLMIFTCALLMTGDRSMAEARSGTTY